MAYVLRQIYNGYWTFMVDYSGNFSVFLFCMIRKILCFFVVFLFLYILDSRSDDLPLVNSPITIFGICFAYLYAVLSLGPRFMKNRKPFEIKNILIVYNAFQIVSNVFVWFYVS